MRQWEPWDALGKGVRNIARHGLAIAKEFAGAERHFCIRGSYRHRTEVLHFDDTKFKDEYQREVYLRAAASTMSAACLAQEFERLWQLKAYRIVLAEVLSQSKMALRAVLGPFVSSGRPRDLF